MLSAERLSTFAAVPSSLPGSPDAIGLDAAAGIGVSITPALDVHAGARYQDVRYRVDAWPVRTGWTGTVRDQTLAGVLGIGLTL